MIKNLTTRKIISKESRVCTNALCKGFGLMFRLKYPKYALVFAFNTQRFIPITMWFCFFSLDLVYLDKNFKVTEKKDNLQPWKNYFPSKKAKYVVELQVGLGKMVNVGDKLLISDI